MAIRRSLWAVWLWRAAALLLALALSACVSSSAPPQAVALRIVSAAVAVSPASYPGACGGSETFRYTATLAANASNGGGRVHYRWRIGYTTAEGDVSFAAGETSQQVTHTVTTTVQPDAEPLLLSAIQTTAPNVILSPQVAVPLPCSAPLQILSADAMVSPASAGCGSHTFGFAAILAAPEGNPGGAVRYTWHFLDGSSHDDSVSFVPGQINATVTAAATYFVLSGRKPAALSPQSFAAPLALPSPPPFPTPRPTPTRTPKPTLTPTRTPKPTPTPGPLGKPAHAGEIGAWLSITAPNTLQSDTVAPEIDC
jgi:hypothetical protein